MTDNIDLSSVCGGQVSWTPIGNANDPFGGTFDGDGYEITGLYINSISMDAHRGLFGYVDVGGTVKNVGVSGDVTVKPIISGMSMLASWWDTSMVAR